MRILFLARLKYPHRGGVEKHIFEISKHLKSSDHKVSIISEVDIKPPKVKFLGLLFIWWWLFKNRKIIEESEIIHCHDVFIWYLPFRFLYPNKKIFITFHGWEGKYPIPLKNIIFKRMANQLSSGSIAIGKYIEKYYGIKANKILYGGVDTIDKRFRKIKNRIIWLGRLDSDTGILKFLNWLKVHKEYKVSFVGEGQFKNECKKYGKVFGSIDPKPFLNTSEICIPAGYLSYIEAKSSRCRIMTFADNPLKEDYWSEIKKVSVFPSWKEISNAYLDLWNG